MSRVGSWVSLLAFVLVGCGDQPAIRGSATGFYLTESEELPVAADLESAEVQVASYSPDGGWQVFEGVGRADGTFEVSGEVPDGEYLLRVEQSDDSATANVSWLNGEWYALTSRTPALVRDFVGRPDAVWTSASGTAVRFDLENLAAWEGGDWLTLFSFDAGGRFSWAPDSDGSIGLGEVELHAELDLSALDYEVALVDADRGDVAYIMQFESEASAAGESFWLSRLLELEDLQQREGQLASLGGTLEQPERRNLDARYDGSEFLKELSRVGRDISVYECRLWVSPFPSGMEHGSCVDCPMVGSLQIGDCAADAAVSLPYGKGFPDESLRVGGYVWFDVSIAPFGGYPGGFGVFMTVELPGIPEDGARIRPVVGVVLEPSIDGVDAYREGTVIGTEPLISWAPPDLGVPDEYRILVERVFTESGFTRFERVGYFYTASTTLRVPPGTLVSGEHYFLLIESVVLGREGTIGGRSPMVSAVVTVE